MSEKEIKAGDIAPGFKLKSYNAGIIDLHELLKNQKVILIFSRYFGCPLCQLDLKTLLNRSEELEKKGARIIYITQSGEKIAKDYIAQKGIKFPVIPSSKDELYKSYGLGLITLEAMKQVGSKLKEANEAGFVHGEYEGWEKQGPGQFVIDNDGTIIHAKKGWLDVDAILEIL
ncbi:MAG: AhpC/TSA family protein [Candidatus Lokiarchaeota archaeon]|nr:AhpC/TSA family protein [Candidatus Lokiarchaeota archaeon]